MFFSIILITYNREEIDHCINNVFAQSENDFELIIIDDHSDIPASKRSDLIDKDERIRYFYLPENKGPSGARNVGINESKGRYIAFLDDDDIWRKEKLAEVKRAILANSYPKLVYHKAEIKMIREGKSYFTHPIHPENEHNLFKKMLCSNVIGGTPMLIFDRTFLKGLGGFDEKLRARVDYELLIRTTKYTDNLLYIDKPLTICQYTTKRNSITKKVDFLIDASRMIDEKYARDIERLLNKNDLTKKNEYYYSTLAHSLLLNYNKGCISYYFKAFLSRLNVKYLIGCIIALINPRLLFSLR